MVRKKGTDVRATRGLAIDKDAATYAFGGPVEKPVAGDIRRLMVEAGPVWVSGHANKAAEYFAKAVDALERAVPEPGEALAPVHPGEILAEEFLTPLSLTAISVARLVNVPRTRIERLIAGQTSMTPDTALRLERLFGASAQFWLNLQTAHDLHIARLEAPDLDVIKPYKRDDAEMRTPTAHG